MFQQQLSKEQALQKIKHYCGYQERSHKEVKEKLYRFKLRKDVVEEIIAYLIEENYLNEERFATQFAGGKFRTRQWGRKKIMYELRERGISQYCINNALQSIDEESYNRVLQKLAEKKWASLKKEQGHLIRLQKTRMYLLQKGYEQANIEPVLQLLKEAYLAGVAGTPLRCLNPA